MRLPTLVLGWLALVLLAIPARAEVIRVGGSGSGLGTVQLLAQAFEKQHPMHRFEVLPALGSTGGVKALRAGQLQIAVSSRALKEEEKAAGLHPLRYGITPLAVVTHASVPATAMTRDRLARLLSGAEARWPNGQVVRVVLRPTSDADHALLGSLSPAVAEALRVAHGRPGMVVAQTDREAADYVERTPGALAALTLAEVTSEQRQVNVLSIDGVAATPAMAEAGRYPMLKEQFLVLRSDASEAVRAFATFVTGSPEAAVILRRTGHVLR